MKFFYFSNNQELSKEDLYDNIIKASLEGDKTLLMETLNLAKYTNTTLDLSYKDGLLPVLAAQKGNYEVLRILCDYDKNLIPIYGVEMLSHAASHGQIDCVNFLLEQKISPSELKHTTAYNNYHEVEQIFTEYEAKHQVNFGGEAIVDIHNDF